MHTFLKIKFQVLTFLKIYTLLCMCLCVCTRWNGFRGQKRASDPLNLELQADVSLLMWVLGTNPLQEQPALLAVSCPSVTAPLLSPRHHSSPLPTLCNCVLLASSLYHISPLMKSLGVDLFSRASAGLLSYEACQLCAFPGPSL